MILRIVHLSRLFIQEIVTLRLRQSEILVLGFEEEEEDLNNAERVFTVQDETQIPKFLIREKNPNQIFKSKASNGLGV